MLSMFQVLAKKKSASFSRDGYFTKRVKYKRNLGSILANIYIRIGSNFRNLICTIIEYRLL